MSKDAPTPPDCPLVVYDASAVAVVDIDWLGLHGEYLGAFTIPVTDPLVVGQRWRGRYFLRTATLHASLADALEQPEVGVDGRE